MLEISKPDNRDRVKQTRRLTKLMVARVLVATLTLGTVVGVHLLSNQATTLGGPFGWFVCALLTLVYLASIGYAIALPRVEQPLKFGALQLAVDIAVITALVHVTGGAESGFASMYLLVVVAASVLELSSRAVVRALIASVVSYVVVSMAGYGGLLPALVGQPFLPWDTTPQILARSILLNTVALGAVALLSNNLAEQARVASQRAAHERAAALDMAALAENIVRSLSSGLITVDEQGTIVSVNAVAEHILVGKGEPLLGRPLLGLVPQMANSLERAGAEPVRRTEMDYARGGEVLHLGVSVSPLNDGEGRVRGRVINFSDLTELKRKDIELKQKDRLAAIGQLAAGVAHEIRNPLAAISGSIELLAATPQVGQENQKLMAIVIREVDRLNNMISDLLAYARPRQPEVQPLDLGTLVEETVRVFQQDRTQPGIEVQLDRVAPAGPLLARVDPAQIRQVIWNLLRNGSEAMPGGGKLRVRLVGSGSRVGFEVSDEGYGISAEDQEHIFEPFFTTKDRGTGLGLATVHRVVEDHGGHIDLRSQVSQGTTMRIWLPRATA